jgi:hypothetical protein
MRNRPNSYLKAIRSKMNRILSKSSLIILSLLALIFVSGCDSQHKTGITKPGPVQLGQDNNDQFMSQDDPKLYSTSLKFFPSAERQAAKKRLWRLSKPQIDSAASNLLAAYSPTSIAKQLPPDPDAQNYRTFSDRLEFNSSNIPPYLVAVQSLTEKISLNPEKLFVCSQEKDIPLCREKTARSFAAKAFRTSPEDIEVRNYAEFFKTSLAKSQNLGEASADFVEAILTSPRFLYRDEVNSVESSNISGHDLVANLALTITDKIPAQIGVDSDSTAANLKNQKNISDLALKILNTPAASEKLASFFWSWLELKESDSITKSTAVFPDFTDETAVAVVQETKKFLDLHLRKPNPSLKNIMSSNESYITPELQKIYELTKAPPNAGELTALDPLKRRGVLTQAGFLASHADSTKTSIVKRGNFFLKKALCISTPSTPPGVSTDIPESANTTQREKITALTGNQPCATCHRYINPFGFALENFDAIGRWRVLENGKTIDASTTIDFVGGTAVKTQTPIEAIAHFTDSYQFKQCFVRQLFRYYMGRNEEPSDDPILRNMFYRFVKDDQDIHRPLEVLATSARFKQRQ